MALPWIIGGLAALAVAAIASDSDDDKKETTQNSARDDIENRNKAAIARARKREREEAQRRAEQQLENKKQYALENASELLKGKKAQEHLATLAVENMAEAKNYALSQWEKANGEKQDKVLNAQQVRLNILTQLKQQLGE